MAFSCGAKPSHGIATSRRRSPMRPAGARDGALGRGSAGEGSLEEREGEVSCEPRPPSCQPNVASGLERGAVADAAAEFAFDVAELDADLGGKPKAGAEVDV